MPRQGDNPMNIKDIPAYLRRLAIYEKKNRCTTASIMLNATADLLENIGTAQTHGGQDKTLEWDDLSLKKFKRAALCEPFDNQEYDCHFLKDGKEIK